MAYDAALGRKPAIERQKSDPTRLNPATTADLPAISHASAANGRLKFNQSFEIVLRDSNMQRVQRFLSKFAMDVLRTMVASAIGALIFTHLGWLGASPVPTQAPVVTVAPTVPTVPTEQVARLVRDEHDVMVQYLKAAHAKEVAAIEKEVREAKAARIAQETAKAAPETAKAPPETARAAPETAAAIGPAEPGRSVAAPRSIAAARAPSLDGANANSSATIVGGAPPVGGVGPATGANSPGGAIVAGSLPPPIVIPALPEPAPPSQVETPRDMSLADKAVAVTHIKDVVSFVRDVSSWFKHEEAPVPPADVRLSPFASAEM
jgi:hypothetical protein